MLQVCQCHFTYVVLSVHVRSVLEVHFITVYLPMPMVISCRISVNCHPVAGRLHVGHCRPLLPSGPTRCVRDLLLELVGLRFASTSRHVTDPKQECQTRREETVCFRANVWRDSERRESRTTHPEDSEAQDSQPILLTCHTAPARCKALPNCSAC